MMRSLPRSAALLLAALLACSPDAPVSTDLDRVAALPLHNEADTSEAAPPDSGAYVLWPSDEVWSEPEEGMVAMAAVASPVIRIGVVQQSSTVQLGATADWTIRDRANGTVVMTGVANSSAAVTLAAVPEAYLYVQVMCGSTSAVSTRKAAAEALGYFTFTEFVPAANCTRLRIGRLPTNATTAQRTAFRNTLISQGLADATSFFTTVTIGTQTIYRVTRGATSVQNVNPVVITVNSADAGFVTIGTSPATLRRYRGKGEARINSAASLAGVNELPIEEYLYGVLPGELGPVQYPEFEAQKAQAVAARTYGYAGLGKRASDGYDLRATTDDQVYLGYPVEHPVSNAAVDATAGVVATYDGKLISANFSSTSGGHTASNEEAFVGSPVAYLRGVPDRELGEAMSHVPSLEVFRAHANPRSLRSASEGDFESNWASFHRWSFEWTPAEISQVVSTYAGRAVGRVLAINVLARGPSGRVLAIEYVTETGTVTDLRRDGIRGSLRFINASGNPQNLPSTLFFVEPVKENGEETGGFRVWGGGFGHGVGLAQTGAVGMAQRGHTFDQILRHYYQGITLETRW